MRRLILLTFTSLLFGQTHWKIDSTLAATETMEFSTERGSWMSVDISPDGKTIIFDLLGDIYKMPANGGTATPILSGRAWQIQPRFSPDGKRIAFVSDQDGADNIWTSDLNGDHQKQITRETKWLPNDPVWHPSKPYLIVKRHFRKYRSLGAGEVWMYHLSGSKGMRLTKRDNFTANAGEPAISPNGRYIYYVRATAFDYNKDVNGTIYWMSRYDTKTGKDERNYLRLYGGSVRPGVSPDGNTLSFINRDRGKSELVLMDLNTGKIRVAFTNLDRDQQEAWAVFGTYPKYRWINNSEILIAIKGQINRLNVNTGKATVIPFTVPVKQRFTKRVTRDETLPDKERVKVIRWAVKYEDQILYSALGKIYEKEGNDKPERWIGGTSLQYAPSFRSDGRSVVFVTWTDKDKGAVYTARSSGGSIRKITTDAAQYANPVYSANGRLIAYLKGSNTARIHSLGSESNFDIMIYDGQRERKVTSVSNGMPRLYFTPDNNRIVFTVRSDGKTLLKSVNLDGHDERIHASSTYAVEMAPSPDFTYLTYKYLHKIYFTTFDDLGQAIELGTSSGMTPVKKLSDGSGDWLGWTADGKTAYWTQGEYLISVKAASVFSDDGPTLDSMNISFTYDTYRRSGRIAFTNAKIITMEGNKVIERGTVLVENNRIKAVGENIQIPSGTKSMDMSGKVIMPGLIDVHAHMHYNTYAINPEKQWPYYANLAFGVTSTHDPSASTQLVFAQSEMVKAGVMVGPRIYSTGFILYGAENVNKAPISTFNDAKGHLKRLKDVGAFSVKSYNQLRRDQRQMVIKAAQEENMLVMPEGGSTHHYNMTMILDGHTGIEHNLPIAELYDDAIQFVGNAGANIVPTLVVSYGGISGERYWYQTENVWENTRLQRFYPRRQLDAISRRRTMAPLSEYYHIEISKTLKKLHDAGAKIHLGAHGQLQGLAAHWELWMFAQGGMSNHDVLKCGTIYPAEYIGLKKDLGSIKTGKMADLLILDKDPLEDIKNTQHIRYTMANGVLYESETMNQVYPKNVKFDGFFSLDGAAMIDQTIQCSCQQH